MSSPSLQELHPTLVLGFWIQLPFPRQNQLLLVKNAAYPQHTLRLWLRCQRCDV